VGFVRWTEQRNFEAVLDMMADGRLDVKPLISHRFAIDDAEGAYAWWAGPGRRWASCWSIRRQESALAGPVAAPADGAPTAADGAAAASAGGAVSLGFVGSGNYATAVLIPAFKATGARLKVVASNAGVSGLHAARKFGFEETSTDTAAVIADAHVNAW
jgi:hypothetical protein